VAATTRADVNGLVRRHMDVRKASFGPVDAVTSLTGMEYGGITPIGLPPGWPVLVDAAVAKLGDVLVVIGSGIRGSKLWLPARLLAELPGAEVLPGLGVLGRCYPRVPRASLTGRNKSGHPWVGQFRHLVR